MTAFIDPRQKLFSHLERLAALQAGQTPPPVSVEIDLSNRCSRGCTWCHFAYTHTRGPLAGKRPKPQGAVAGGDLMPLELARDILGQLAASGVHAVTWAGGGEPTLHPNVDEIFAHAAALGLQQGMYTHGGHLDPERAARVKRLFAWVYVSLDEVDAESYAASKGGGFERSCQGIQNLAAAEGKATVGVGFLLHQANWRRAAEMIALGRELGGSYVQLRPTILYDQDQPGRPGESRAWLNEALALLEPLQAPDVLCDLERFRMYRDWAGHGYTTCWFAALSTVITPNGKVWRCCNTRERPGSELGDLTNESFAALWARAGGPQVVNDECRVMCRGHLANLTLDRVMAPREHAAFV